MKLHTQQFKVLGRVPDTQNGILEWVHNIGIVAYGINDPSFLSSIGEDDLRPLMRHISTIFRKKITSPHDFVNFTGALKAIDQRVLTVYDESGFMYAIADWDTLAEIVQFNEVQYDPKKMLMELPEVARFPGFEVCPQHEVPFPIRFYSVKFDVSYTDAHELLKLNRGAYSESCIMDAQTKRALEIIVPVAYNALSMDDAKLSERYVMWRDFTEQAESTYYKLIKKNENLDTAASVLPNQLKVSLVMTAASQDWKIMLSPDSMFPNVNLLLADVREALLKEKAITE